MPHDAIFPLGAMIGFWLIAGLVSLFGTIFWIVEIVDVVRRQFNDDATKIVWLLVIVFTHFVGAVLYYFIGKQQGTLPGESYRY